MHDGCTCVIYLFIFLKEKKGGKSIQMWFVVVHCYPDRCTHLDYTPRTNRPEIIFMESCLSQFIRTLYSFDMHAIYSCSCAHLGHFIHTCVSLFWYMTECVTICVSLDLDRCIHIRFALSDQFIHIYIWTWFPDTSGLNLHVFDLTHLDLFTSLSWFVYLYTSVWNHPLIPGPLFFIYAPGLFNIWISE